MNIYVIYKFDDYEIVKKKIDEISKVISPDVIFLCLKTTAPLNCGVSELLEN